MSISAAVLRARAEAAAGALPPLMLARGPVAALSAPGGHGLRRPGMGEDFWQYRVAHEGDTAASVDWRRSGRGDVQFVRDRERQTARRAAIWIGRGAGMGYGGQPGETGTETKIDRARLIALALALALIRGHERVGLLGGVAGSGGAQAERLSQEIAGLQPGAGDADSPDPAAIRPGQTVLLIDDFLFENSELPKFLDQVAGAGAGGVVLQLLHPDEESFPFDGAVRFETAGGLRHETRDAGGLRAAYLARLDARRADLRAMAGRAGFVFGTHSLDHPASDVLIWLHGVLSAR